MARIVFAARRREDADYRLELAEQERMRDLLLWPYSFRVEHRVGRGWCLIRRENGA